MKKILIDARLFGTKHTGIGRYIENLLDNLNSKKNNYTLLVNSKDPEKKYKKRFNYLYTSIKHYSFEEQIFLPLVLYKSNFNLVHFTHFNKPVLYLKKSVITIHDLIKNFYFGSDTTTRFGLTYWFKYVFYRIFTFINIKNNFIIVPTKYWQDYIQHKYKINLSKIIYTHESFDLKFHNKKIIKKPENYIVYTGNLYPHKNINIIFECLTADRNLKLKIIGKDSIFKDRLIKKINSLGIKKQVSFLGYLPDNKFRDIYSHALALVHPAFMEGFCLTGLESMALNCPVVASNTSCMPEVYKDSVLYFNPNSKEELLTQINKLKNTDTRMDFIKRGQQHLRLFSWKKMSELTQKYYEQILS